MDLLLKEQNNVKDKQIKLKPQKHVIYCGLMFDGYCK